MSFRYFTKWRQPHSEFQKPWKTLKKQTYKRKAHRLVFWVTLQVTTNVIKGSRHFCRVISWGFLLALSSSPTRLKMNKHETPLSTAFYMDAPKASSNWCLCKRKYVCRQDQWPQLLTRLGTEMQLFGQHRGKAGDLLLANRTRVFAEVHAALRDLSVHQREQLREL